MKQKLTGILWLLALMLSGCSQTETAKHPDGNTALAPSANTPLSPTPETTLAPSTPRPIPSVTAATAPAATSLDGLPTSPGAMVKKLFETIGHRDAEWYMKYTRAASIRIASRVKNEPVLSDEQIRNQFAMMTGMKRNKADARSIEIIREITDGDRSQVSLMIYRVDNTSETVQSPVTKIDGMWIVGDFPIR